MRRIFNAAYFPQVSLSLFLQPAYGVDTWFTEIMRTNSGVHKSQASVRVAKFFMVALNIDGPQFGSCCMLIV